MNTAHVPTRTGQRLFLPGFVRRSRVGIALVSAVASSLAPAPVHALPTGGQLVAGDVATTLHGSQLTLDQASRTAIMNWRSFDIGQAELVRILQSGPDAAMLARVTGADPTQLLGQLRADGKLFLINPRGILVGEGAVIDTAAFLASTLDVADGDFLRGGPLTLQGDSAAGVINLGRITAREGNVLLLAYTVKNAGEISAARGTAGLGAGTAVYLAAPDAPAFVIKANLASGTGTGVDNPGIIAAAQAQLEAAGGSIYDLAVNHSGVIKATGVERRPDGRVVLTARGGTVGVSGAVGARDADGSGGEILVGGDYQGKNVAIANADNTVVTAAARLEADAAAATGAGGRVIVWGDRNTRFLGTLSARGAPGGFAEVSGRDYLDFNPRTPADLGPGGTLLLDPTSLRINSAFPDENNVGTAAGPPFVFSGIDSSSRLRVSTLEAQLATTNVVLDTSTRSGDITFESSVAWASANTLRVTSGNNIVINDGVDLTGTSATLELYSGRQGDASDQLLGPFRLTGDITQGAGGTIAVNTLTVGQNTASNFAGSPGNLTVYDNPSHSGDATFNGVLNVGTLQKDLSARTGALIAANAGNMIGTFRTTGSGGDTGNINVRDGAGDLGVMLSLPSTSASSIRVVTSGNLNLASGTAISFANPTGDVILAADGGAFVNAAGASAIGANARHLVYTSTAEATGKGGLGGTNVGNHPYDANETFADTVSRFFFTGAAPVVPNLTYSANDVSRTYGDANPTLGYSVTGFDDGIDNDVAGEPSLSTVATLISGVGSYEISIGPGTLQSSNYGFVFSPGSLTVTPAPVTIAVNHASRLYGAANPQFSGNYSTGLKNGDPLSALGTWSFGTSATAASNVGSYAITGAAGGASPNYTVSFTPGTLDVTPAPLTVTANNAARLYGAANPAFSATPTGLVNGDTLAQAVPDLAWSTAATTASGVGAYAITLSGTSSNYAPVFTPGTLSVTPAPLLVTANNAARTYGDANPGFSYALSGLVNGDAASVVSGVGFLTAATIASGVGSYPVTPTGGSAANYALSYAPGSLTVSKANLSIDIANIDLPYGHGNPTFALGNLTGLKNDDTAAVIQNLSFSTTTPVSSTALPGTTYTILASGDAANYNLTWSAGSLRIVRAPATISVNSASKVYGDGLAAITPSYVGFLPADEATVRSNWKLANPDAVGLGAGLHPLDFVVQNQGLAATFNALYDIVVQGGTLEVMRAPLTVAALNLSMVYGGTLPALSYTVVGLRNGDQPSVLGDIGFDQAFLNNIGVGTHPYNLGNIGAAANYEVTQMLPGTLTVTPAPLTLAGAVLNVNYGDPLPSLGYTVSGLRNGDSASVLSGVDFDTAFFSNIGPGTYAYGFNHTGTAANYVVNQVRPGSLTVDRRPVTITAGSAETVAGVIPPFTSTIAGGAVAGAGFTVEYQAFQRTGALLTPVNLTSFSAPGEYVIRPVPIATSSAAAETLNSAYRFTLVDGTFTIKPSPTGTNPLTDLSTLTLAPTDTLAEGELILSGTDLDLEKAKEDMKKVDYTAAEDVRIKLGSTVTPRQLATMTNELSNDLLGYIPGILEGPFLTNAQKELLKKVKHGSLTPEQFARLVENDPDARAAVMPLLAQVMLTKVENGEELSPTQQNFVARMAANVGTYRQTLKDELIRQRQDFIIQRAQDTMANQYALKTMPDIARSAEQMATERAIAAGVGVGAGVATAAIVGAGIKAAAGVIFPSAAGGAVGSAAAAGGAAVVVALVVVVVVSGVMVVQEGDNIKAYDAAMKRAETPVAADLSNLNFKDEATRDTTRAEFLNAFLMTMNEVGYSRAPGQ